MKDWRWIAILILFALLISLVAGSAWAQNPVITNVQEGNVTDTTATITWNTDELANSTVNYGNTTPLSQTESNSTFTTSHVVYLTGLNPDTWYQYEVCSSDVDGNTTCSPGNVSYYLLHTEDAPPIITNVGAGNITDITATIFWATDQLSNSTVNYGTTTSLGSTAANSTLVYNHSVDLTGLIPGSLYYYEVVSTNSDGQTTVDNNSGAYYNFNTTYAFDLQGWGVCSSCTEVVSATFDGYTTMLERSHASDSYSMHAQGNLTLDSPCNETIPLDLYGSRVRSMFYLRQEITGKSAHFLGTWLEASGNQTYIGMSGWVALPNPDGSSLKTARLCFFVLRTPDVEVPLTEPGSFVEDVESMLTRFFRFLDKVLDNLIGTGFGEILSDILTKLAVLLSHLRALGTPFIP